MPKIKPVTDSGRRQVVLEMVGKSWRAWKVYSLRRGRDPLDSEWVVEYIKKSI